MNSIHTVPQYSAVDGKIGEKKEKISLMGADDNPLYVYGLDRLGVKISSCTMEYSHVSFPVLYGVAVSVPE